ncbi:MAG: helix-turn-helix transcriptional regulator [Polaromonas sp.]|nr:helix-turn-helix transcriptional regulator [Polaromonas sp.]
MVKPSSRAPVEIEVRQAFGATVRKLREDSAITQEVLAHQSGLSVSYVSLLERGKKTATLFSAARLAHVFGMTLTQVIALTESESSPKPR